MMLNNVLIIDGDDISNYLSRNVIEAVNYTKKLVIKKDAKDALDYIRKNTGSFRNHPELILLDLKTQGMDGFEFLDEYEKSVGHLLGDTVLVILSSSRNASEVEKLKERGDYTFISKPLTPAKLSDLFEQFFQDRPVSK